MSLRKLEVTAYEGESYYCSLFVKIDSCAVDTDSVYSNISLVKNNARVGAEVAKELSNIKSESSDVSTKIIQTAKLPSNDVTNCRVICVGGAVIDTVAKNIEGNMILGTSNPGKIHQSDGGVGRNIAETLGRLGSEPLFYTAIGNDELGRGLLQRLEDECGVITNHKSIYTADGIGTAQYYALNDESSTLIGAIADMDVLMHIPIPEVDDLNEVEFLVLDANLHPNHLIEAARRGVEARCKVCFEPVSVPKASKMMTLDFLQCITYAFPNEDELFGMAKVFDENIDISSDTDSLEHAASVLLFNMKSDASIVVTRGRHGVMLAANQHTGEEPVFRHFPTEKITNIRSSNGPGDTLCGAFIHALLQGCDNAAAVKFGMKAAALSLQHEGSAISPDLSSLKV
jgi:sugar/nucleoside kinase (ribokinase family)